MVVTVPAGVTPGQRFQINTQAGAMQVICPDGVSGGGQMIVNIPEPVEVQACPIANETMAVPIVAAVPMVAPVPMQMSSPAGASIIFPLGLDKRAKLQEIKTRGVPPALADRGMTPGQWTACCEAVDTVADAQFFRNCPTLECIYWCVPGGPIQCALCMFNPFTWLVIVPPVERAKKYCTEKCNAILQQYGYEARALDGMEVVIRFDPAGRWPRSHPPL